MKKMSRKFDQRSEEILFSDDWSTIPDSGTQHGFELASQQTPEQRATDQILTPSTSRMKSEERKHYNRALRDLCRIVKLSGRKLEEVEGQMTSGMSSRGGSRRRERDRLRERQMLSEHRGDSEDFVSLSDPDVTLMERIMQETSRGLGNMDDHHGDDAEDSDLYDETEFYSRDRKSRLPRGSPIKEPRSVDAKDRSMDRSLDVTSSDLGAVYAELVTISSKLQKQSAAIQEREEALLDRERIVDERDKSLQSLHGNQSAAIQRAYKEFSKKWNKLQEEHDKQVSELEGILKERTRENKRQKESFDTLKQANDVLRTQLDTVEEQNKKLEAQTVSLQSRLTNLLRRQELTGRQRDQESVAAKARAESVKRQSQSQQHHQQEKSAVSSASEATHTYRTGTGRISKHSSGLYDTVGILLEWVSEVHLKHHSVDPAKPLESLPSPALTHDRCTRILPALVEVLGQLPAQASKLHLPCLQFIYWALLHLDSSEKQRVSLSATYRRLGDELYRPVVVRFASDRDKMSTDGTAEKPKSAIFFKSANLHIRFLSSLIILKTVNQVDYLANVFDVLRCDLKDERTKELFLRYHATPILLPYMKAGNRAITGCAVDIFLQMSMESIFMEQFLSSCSTEMWFRSCAALLTSPGLDIKVMEKLSIILQKLSKRANRHLFDASGTSALIQEMTRSGACQENAFLALNLRSILFNLNLIKGNSSSVR